MLFTQCIPDAWQAVLVMKNHSSIMLKVRKVRLFESSRISRKPMRIAWWLFVSSWSSWRTFAVLFDEVLEIDYLKQYDSSIGSYDRKIPYQIFRWPRWKNSNSANSSLWKLSKFQGGLWLTSWKRKKCEKLKIIFSAWQTCGSFPSPHWGVLFTSSQNSWKIVENFLKKVCKPMIRFNNDIWLSIIIIISHSINWCSHW